MSLPTCPPELWIAQARSDREAGITLRAASTATLRCHAVAKYQQAVEKCIKAMALALHRTGLAQVPEGDYYTHDPLEMLIRALSSSPTGAQERTILRRVQTALADPNRAAEVKAVCSLAPRKPRPGQLHDRNTEYPYETSAGVWVAPAEPQSFSPVDVSDAERIAGTIYRAARKIVTAAARMP